MDRFEGIQAFLRVVEDGSISRAADRLAISKSVVSRRLKELEAHLGVQLVVRTTRRISVTDHGRQYYEQCSRILAELEAADATVADRSAQLGGVLRVAAPVSFGILHLTPAINAFLIRHPNLKLDLDLSDEFVDLVAAGHDMAVRITRPEDSSLIARKLCPIRVLACASPGYLAAHGEPRHPQELSNHVCLQHRGSSEHAATWSYAEPEGRAGRVRVPVRINCNNGDILRDAAIGGLGIVCEPTFIMHKAIESGQLVPILTEYEWPQLSAFALYPASRHVPRRVRAFIDFLVERFSGRAPYWDKAVPEPGKPS